MSIHEASRMHAARRLRSAPTRLLPRPSDMKVGYVAIAASPDPVGTHR